MINKLQDLQDDLIEHILMYCDSAEDIMQFSQTCNDYMQFASDDCSTSGSFRAKRVWKKMFEKHTISSHNFFLDDKNLDTNCRSFKSKCLKLESHRAKTRYKFMTHVLNVLKLQKDAERYYEMTTARNIEYFEELTEDFHSMHIDGMDEELKDLFQQLVGMGSEQFSDSCVKFHLENCSNSFSLKFINLKKDLIKKNLKQLEMELTAKDLLFNLL